MYLISTSANIFSTFLASQASILPASLISFLPAASLVPPPQMLS